MNANRMKVLLRNKQNSSNHVFLSGPLGNYQGGKNLTQNQWLGPTTLKDMLKSASRDIVNKPTKNRSCTKSQLFAFMIITSRSRNGNRLEICPPMYVLKCLYLPRIDRLDSL